MECDKAKELLSAYLDGEVTEKERHLLEEHLASCKSCRQELEELRRIVGLVASLPKEAAPEGFAQRTVASLPAPGTGAPERLRKFFLRPRWAFASGALATAALILIAMSLLYWPGPGVPSVPTLQPVAKVRSAAPETGFVRKGVEVAAPVRVAEKGIVDGLAETEISEEVPSAAEVIALAGAFREDILADKKVEELGRVAAPQFSRWEKEMAAREEEERKERYKAQSISNSEAYSFVQKENVAGPNAQYIYLASRNLENARKEVEDILAFTEKNGRRGRALVPIGIAPAGIRAKISRKGPKPRGFAITVNLTDEELEQVVEQAIWADNFITTAIEWPARPARRMIRRRAYMVNGHLEEEKEEKDADAYSVRDEARKPLSQTVLILLEEER